MKAAAIIAAIIIAGCLGWLPDAPQTAMAGEKVVKMTVSGCTS